MISAVVFIALFSSLQWAAMWASCWRFSGRADEKKFRFYHAQRSAGSCADVKDDVSCLDMPTRHSWIREWNYGTFVTSSPWQRLRTFCALPPRNFTFRNRPCIRQIRDLEDELGVQLFERTGKAVKLTDAGRLFLKDARAVLERTDEAVANVRAFAQTGETELHVGYSPLPGAQILPAALRAFQQAMPKVHVKLHDWSSEKIAVGLRDGRLRVALVARPLKRGAFGDFRFEELLREHIRLAVPTEPSICTTPFRLAG